MKTLFLASGKSSRMDPLSDKNFLKFGGMPLCVHLLKRAYMGGARNFILISNGDNKAALEAVVKEYDFLKEAQIVVQKVLEEGMAGGISEGLQYIKDDESVLILGGNDGFDHQILESVLNPGKDFDGAILAQKVDTYFPGGYLKIDENESIQSIIEKPGKGAEPSDLVNIVCHYFQKSQHLKQALNKAASQKDDVYETALDILFKTQNFKAIKYEGRWQAVKYPWQVLDMMDFLLSDNTTAQIHPTAEVSDKATLKGPGIIIDQGARIFENAVIQGPAYIGKNAVVGNNALVRESHIGVGSTVGYNTEVARSYLADKVTTHIAYIGDSVIDEGVNFGAYSCTANLRLDQENVKMKVKNEVLNTGRGKLGSIVGKGVQIGIGAKLMPGVKISMGEKIMPGVIFSPQK